MITKLRMGVLLIAILSASLLLSACTTPAETPSDEPAAGEEITLTLIHPWAGEEWDQFAPVVAAAEEALGITIEPIVLRSDDLITQLSTQWAAGTAPGDVIFLTVPSLIKQGAEDGHVMEVTGLVNPADFSPGAVDFNTIDGKVYGVPFCEGVKPGFWYRKSFFQEHGLSEPTTKAEFVALLEQMQGIEGIKAPIGSGNGDGWPLSDIMEHFLVAYEGPELLTELSNCTCPGSWDKVEGVFVNDFAPLVEAGHFSEPIEWTTAMEMWWNGDFALYFMGNWLTAMVDDPGDLGLIPIPGTEGVAGAVDFLFVSTYTEHPEEAKALLAWLATTGQEVRASQGGTVATYLAVSPDAYPPAERMMADAIAEMTPLFDLDDSIGGGFQTTFWDQLKLLWVSPDRAAEVVDIIHDSYNDACGCD